MFNIVLDSVKTRCPVFFWTLSTLKSFHSKDFRDSWTVGQRICIKYKISKYDFSAKSDPKNTRAPLFLDFEKYVKWPVQLSRSP